MRLPSLAFSMLLLSSGARADTCFSGGAPDPGDLKPEHDLKGLYPDDLAQPDDLSQPADLSSGDGGLLGLRGRAGKRRVGYALLVTAPLGLLWLGLRRRRPGDPDSALG